MIELIVCLVIITIRFYKLFDERKTVDHQDQDLLKDENRFFKGLFIFEVEQLASFQKGNDAFSEEKKSSLTFS